MKLGKIVDWAKLFIGQNESGQNAWSQQKCKLNHGDIISIIKSDSNYQNLCSQNEFQFGGKIFHGTLTFTKTLTGRISVVSLIIMMSFRHPLC